MNRTASEPRKATTSQASGPASSRLAWKPRRPWRRSADLLPTLCVSVANQPLIAVQAWTQSEESLQTFPRSSPHCLRGVVQNETLSKYAWSSAWKIAQWSLFSVSAHAFALDGASPNHSATWALAFGEMIQSIHMYMQLGCLALEEIIQVSDQPVAPSLGSVVLIGTLSPSSRFAITCQVVPTVESPLANADCSFV